MSNIQLIIEERAANIGNFMVGRLLPFRQKRMIGPFSFIDHMGPTKLSERENLDVLSHPHIGLSTLTYLFEGSIMHRDTLGSALEIKPGEVNWMTAGKGIVHSEKTPEHLRHSDKVLHGLQIWVALPKELEQMEPSFVHIGKEELPTWNEGETQFTLIAGKAFGRESGVPVYSPLYMIEVKSKEKTELSLGDQLFGESGIYILEGGIEEEGNTFGPKQLLVAQDHSLCTFTMEANSTIYIFGGDPFPEERFINWNFVSSDKSLIDKAKDDWINRRFDKIQGEENEFVPYPSLNNR
ncbi:pirin family protein [Aquirufa nivalisilvae]|jgi:redox-sensitive bicupin YhaK (pirin superfamily)|uniref:pirin family protein n=1 Tax=Aquirufa nivalisilvae TaxID=2516557 RepID=UPI0022A9B5D7|nr:pirin family protein [Aquirufa nivalisilvae]MCZ2479699.1 pirin family protein [Aquirufa nivalisilvae]MCZ2481695.1 pirin family protein [Aquirufa nivalisilvae]